jgi:hypothetical protein
VASWLCYFRAFKLGPATLVAPIGKLSVVLVALSAFAFLGGTAIGDGMARHLSDRGGRGDHRHRSASVG